jgi:glycerol-3-phosphate acyltransferase PlsY
MKTKEFLMVVLIVALAFILASISLTAMVVFSFGLGAIPTGYLFSKRKGVDIRTRGSGNIGAANISRTFGLIAGILVFLIDVFKGFFVVKFVSQTPALLFGLYYDPSFLFLLCGLGVVLGNIFSPVLGGKGGKGVSTSLGVILVIDPNLAFWTFAIFITTLVLTRYVSVGSMIAALGAMFIADSQFGPENNITTLITILMVLIIMSHKENIGRLMERTENKVRFPWNKAPA